MEKITVMLPCRKGSTRLGFDKQMSPFAGTTLMDIKIKQLQTSKYIEEIILSTDDERIFDKYGKAEKCIVYERDKSLLNVADADSLVDLCLQHITEGWVLLTHCTSPFFSEYDEVIEFGFNNDCDCVLTARKVGAFVMDDAGNIVNYERGQGKDRWPSTAELPNWYELDHAVVPFMPISVMKELHDRKGYKTKFYLTGAVQSLDIDYIDQWKLAEELYKKI